MPSQPAVSPLSPAAPQAGAAPAPLAADDLLRTLAELLARARFDEAATAMAQHLAARLDCEYAALGWREADAMHVVALSHAATPATHAEFSRLLGAAMDEAADQHRTLTYPEPAAGAPDIVLAHAALARRLDCALCTLPLAHDGRIVGALTLARRDMPFQPDEAQHLERAAALLAPALALKHAAQRPLWRTAFERARAALPAAMRHDGPARRLLLGAAATALVLLGLGFVLPVASHVTAPATLEGAFQRTLTAPADGFLQRAYARAGDRVRAGQVLAELADQDLQVQQRGLEAELAQHENALVSAQARGDREAFIQSQGQAEAARAQLDLVRQQRERSLLRAPFDGVVIKGDLSQSVGAPVARGAELLTLAPSTAYRVMIEADETRIAELRPGQRGELILAALPAHPLAIRVERVTPLASSEPGHHFFAVYAALPAGAPTLRPGMQGYARIEVDKRPLLLGWAQRALNMLRLKLWAWGV